MADTIQKTVKWFLVKKALIQFTDEENSCSVADNVMKSSDYTKFPINKGDVVDVTLNKLPSGDQEVVFMRKVKKVEAPKAEVVKEEPKAEAPKAEAPKAEVQPTTTGTSTSDTKTLTVEAIFDSKGEKSVKFKEETINGKKWTKLSTDLSKQEFKTLGLMANNLVTITLTDGVITNVVVVAKPAEKEEPKSETSSSKKSSYRDEESTDKRTALMVAKDLTVALVASGKIEVTPEIIKEVLTGLTKRSYKILTEI